MLHLINRLHQSRGNAHTRRQTLLDGLCRLTAASVALLLIGSAVASSGRTAQWYTLDSESCDPLLATSVDAEDEESDPAFQKMLGRMRQRQHGAVVTFTRRELTDDRTWYASHHVREVRRKAGVDDCLYSGMASKPDQLACICLSRKWGSRKRFGNREKGILDLLHPACAWAYREQDTPALPDAVTLSPREKQTLWKLLAGRGEKEIAAEMHLSVNTVHHYVKALYRHFNVSSRAELLAKWMERQA
jgi:DNA-binding CsgD family transcriptional regulator